MKKVFDFLLATALIANFILFGVAIVGQAKITNNEIMVVTSITMIYLVKKILELNNPI